MRRAFLLGAALGGSLLLAAACGDDDDDDRAPARAQGGRAAEDAGTAGRTPAAGSGGGLAAGRRSVRIRFQAKVYDQAFSCDRTYPGLGSTHVDATPRDFRFFAQDVALLRADGTEVPFEMDELAPTQTSEVALIDLTEETGSCAGTGKGTRSSEIVGSVPEGSYAGLAFTNAVPEALNHADATADTTKDPLRDISLNWNWVSGYRFIVAEALRVDDDLDAGALADPVSLIHIGSTKCSGSAKAGISCANANRNRVRLEGFDPTTQRVIADFGAVFSGIDLKTGLQCHGTGPECEPLYDAWGIDIATGDALSAQKVFRVE